MNADGSVSAPEEQSSKLLTRIGIVAPCLNEEIAVGLFWDELYQSIGESKNYAFTVFFVDDGSSDGTWRAIQSLRASDALTPVGVRLTRNFGHQNALLCGMTLARDLDAVITMDVDLQDPPEVIPRMIEAWKMGHSVVTCVRKSRPSGDGVIKNALSRLFYRILGFFGGPSAGYLGRDAGDFRLLDKIVLSDLLRFKDLNLYFRGTIPWLGFKEATILYDRRSRETGKTKFSFGGMFRFASGPLLESLARPAIAGLGFLGLMSVFAALVLATYVFISLLSGDTAPGWSSLILVITLFGSLNLLAVFLLGTLVFRLYLMSRNRPPYVISQVWRSSNTEEA